jgi:hypothetical protein
MGVDQPGDDVSAGGVDAGLVRARRGQVGPGDDVAVEVDRERREALAVEHQTAGDRRLHTFPVL